MFGGGLVLLGQHLLQQLVGALQVAGIEGGAGVLFQARDLRRIPGGGGEILLQPFEPLGDLGQRLRPPLAWHCLFAQDAEERPHRSFAHSKLVVQIADRRLLLGGQSLQGARRSSNQRCQLLRQRIDVDRAGYVSAGRNAAGACRCRDRRL
ncbi:MAG: hypothetical protein HWD60_04755 [Defluviicoccus sp.]|nr:MAG: hypothetical protein HWD60_04755 [Defluviicoccus sp.]